jgi:hypothetical protein
MCPIVKENNGLKLGEWVEVKPSHCHQRLPENTLVSKLRIMSKDKADGELLMKFEPEKLIFFFDHEIDHLPGMLEASALRQCALALAHLVYDVPMDYIVILDWINIKLYNYGELNTETIVKSKLIDIKKEKNRITIVLEGLMMQKGYPIMRMKGALIAFTPQFAAKIRHRKITLDSFIGQSWFQKPFIAELHIIIKRNFWQEAYNAILNILKSHEINNYYINPLYVTYDIEDAELRVCFEFKDPSLIDKFVVNDIRKILGIEATRVRLTLDGQIFPRGIKALASTDSPLNSCHIFLKTEPSKDTKIWDNLCKLDEKGSVFPTWIFRDFYEYDRDITLRLMGKNKKDIEEYINTVIKNIDGVLSYKMKFMDKIEKIMADDELMYLAQQWLKTK